MFLVLAAVFVFFICGASAAAEPTKLQNTTYKPTDNSYNTQAVSNQLTTYSSNSSASVQSNSKKNGKQNSSTNQVLPDPRIMRGGVVLPTVYTTIQAAINAAIDGDTILLENGQTFNLSSTLTIGKTLTFDIGDAGGIIPGGTATISGQNNVRIARITSNSKTVTFNNIIFTNGRVTGPGAAIYNNYAGTSITINNCTFTSNTANSNSSNAGNGGAIYNIGTLTINNSSFTSNRAQRSSGNGGFGGAIYNTGTLNINTSIFTSNTGSTSDYIAGGAIYNSGILNVVNSSFTSNSASTGGAIATMNTTSVTGSTFTSNNALTKNGGAIAFGLNNNNPATGTMTITNSRFTDNTSITNGGAVWTYGTSNISNSNFVNNHSNASGGAIRNWGTMTLTSNNFEGNTATTNADAISNFQGTVNAHFNRFISNGSNDINAEYNPTYGPSTVNLQNNWWGVNTGPSTGRVTNAAGATINIGTWLQLRITASPTNILVGSTSTATATILYNNIGTYYDPYSGPHVPDPITGIFTGIPINFSGTLGTVNPTNTVLNYGQATTTFTCTAPGASTVSATVDSQTVNTNILNCDASADVRVNIYTSTGKYDNWDVNNDITWVIDLINNGPDDAHDVVASVVMPAGLEFIGAGARANGSWSYDIPTKTLTWAVPFIPSGGAASINFLTYINNSGSITITATKTSQTEPDPNTSNNSRTRTITIPSQIDIQVTQTVNNPTPNIGDNIIYTINIKNNGPNTATGLTIQDLLPAGLTFVSADTHGTGTYSDGTGIWDIGNFNNGQTATLTLTATVNTADMIKNRALLNTKDQFDWNFNNNSQITIINQGSYVPSGDVRVNIYTSTGKYDNWDVNNNITWVIDLINNGPDDVNNVVASVVMPAGLEFRVADARSNGSWSYDIPTGTLTWTVPFMPNGGAASLDFLTYINNSGSITITATKTSQTEPDPNPSNNSRTRTVTIPPEVDIQVTQTVNNLTPNVGDTIIYTINIKNNGPNTATGLTIQDLLPAGLTFVSADTHGTGTYNDGTGIWDIGNFNNGQTATLTLTATVNSGTSGTIIKNRALLNTKDQFDWNFNNNSQQICIGVI